MKIAFAALTFALGLAATAAWSEDTPLNQPDAGAWNVYGQGQTVKNVRDDAVQGGGYKRVTIANSTTNPWDIGANVEIDKPYQQGDSLTFAVWLRIESSDPNATISVPADIQINQAPYTAVIQGNVDVTTQWQLLYVTGTADKDYAGKGATVASLNIGGQPKVIDLGPAFVIDGGKAQ